MNILMVCNFYSTEKMGGSERYIENLSRELKKLGHKITILTGRDQQKNPLVEAQDGIEIIKYDISTNNFFLCWFSIIWGARKKFLQIVKQRKIDLIVFHHTQSALGVLLTSAGQRRRKIFHFYSSWDKEWTSLLSLKKSWLIKLTFLFWGKILPAGMRKIQRYCLNKSEKIICLSQFSVQELVEIFKCSLQKIVLIPGGVETERFKLPADKNSLRVSKNLPFEKKILLTVRRLVPRTGVDLLIKSMAVVVKENPGVLLLVVGTGPWFDEYKKLIHQLGLEKWVRLTGFISEKELPIYYQLADVFIIPTRELEGFGLVILEALSCGLPVIGTNVGAIAEILSKVEPGLIVQPESELAEVILKFLQGKGAVLSPTQRREYVLTHYCWEVIGQRIEREYQKMLEKS
jgi:glycosyltransferase involved in cell wall biosynthesis